MKKALTTLICLLAITCMIGFATPSFAKDVILETEIQDVVTKLDKNGNEYTRIIITESRTLQGVPYKVTVPVMCFGETVAMVKARQFQSGDILKAIAQTNEYKGRVNYNLVALIE